MRDTSSIQPTYDTIKPYRWPSRSSRSAWILSVGPKPVIGSRKYKHTQRANMSATFHINRPERFRATLTRRREATVTRATRPSLYFAVLENGNVIRGKKKGESKEHAEDEEQQDVVEA